MAVVSAGVMALVAWQSLRVAVDQWDERMASLECSAGLFLVPVAFGAAHSALHLAAHRGFRSLSADPSDHGARMTIYVMLGFFAAAILGMPLAFALGFGAVVGIFTSDLDSNMLPTRMMNAVNAFPLMSIPFFILAGELMMKGGIIERLIDLANAVVGRVRGGLAHVTMLAGLGLSTVSGAAVADASALSGTLMPPLAKVYGVGFAAAVIAAAANLGPIIPPSGAMIVYAFMAGPTVSVGGLFMAGVVPGLILVAVMMAMCSGYRHQAQLPDNRRGLRGAARAARAAGAPSSSC